MKPLILLLLLAASAFAADVTISDNGRVKLSTGEELGTVSSAIANALTAEARGQKPLATAKEIQAALDAWVAGLRAAHAAEIKSANEKITEAAPFIEAAKSEKTKKREALAAEIASKQAEIARLKP